MKNNKGKERNDRKRNTLIINISALAWCEGFVKGVFGEDRHPYASQLSWIRKDMEEELNE